MPVEAGSFEKSAEKGAVVVGAIQTHPHPTVEVTRHRSETVLRLKADGRSIDDIAREADVSRSTVIRILRYVERAAAG
ncbi:MULTISPECIES: helix-turn-helix domain-containing protein [unclassified Rhizobium]|uniref:helix-turn-helix domain-containing protein n=1 Tax=unclassified Rhizobium TaxID=2613769 RepID=UPI00380C180D